MEHAVALFHFHERKDSASRPTHLHEDGRPMRGERPASLLTRQDQLDRLAQARISVGREADRAVQRYAFVGIVVIWIFHAGTGGSASLPTFFLLPLGSFVLALVVDFVGILFALLFFEKPLSWHDEERWGRSVDVEAEGLATYLPAKRIRRIALAVTIIGYAFLAYAIFGRVLHFT